MEENLKILLCEDDENLGMLFPSFVKMVQNEEGEK